MKKYFSQPLLVVFCMVLLSPLATIQAIESNSVKKPIDLSFNAAPIIDVYRMLSMQNNINIVLSDDVSGNVSMNLYGVTIEHAIHAIADASGYIAEKRGGTYFIVERDQSGKDAVIANTTIRSYKIQYADINTIDELVKSYLSRYGKSTMLATQRLIIIEDLPDFQDRIETIVKLVDQQPKQILIEAKILEIALRHDENFGIDWTGIRGDGTFGTQGFTSTTASGFFLDAMTPDINLFLNALTEAGRVRTLSTPRLLVLENQEAEVVIGDRIGFKVTSTINQVTTESIEFLESGVILKVKAAVDRHNRIMLEIHPEVSTATVTEGIPSLTTTEVTTQLLAADGQNILIGGLIKSSITENESGVPVLKDIPAFGKLFKQNQEIGLSTETVVLIRPRIVGSEFMADNRALDERIGEVSKALTLDVDSTFEPRKPGEKTYKRQWIKTGAGR